MQDSMIGPSIARYSCLENAFARRRGTMVALSTLGKSAMPGRYDQLSGQLCLPKRYRHVFAASATDSKECRPKILLNPELLSHALGWILPKTRRGTGDS